MELHWIVAKMIMEVELLARARMKQGDYSEALLLAFHGGGTPPLRGATGESIVMGQNCELNWREERFVVYLGPEDKTKCCITGPMTYDKSTIVYQALSELQRSEVESKKIKPGEPLLKNGKRRFPQAVQSVALPRGLSTVARRQERLTTNHLRKAWETVNFWLWSKGLLTDVECVAVSFFMLHTSNIAKEHYVVIPSGVSVPAKKKQLLTDTWNACVKQEPGGKTLTLTAPYEGGGLDQIKLQAWAKMRRLMAAGGLVTCLMCGKEIQHRYWGVQEHSCLRTVINFDEMDTWAFREMRYNSDPFDATSSSSTSSITTTTTTRVGGQEPAEEGADGGEDDDDEEEFVPAKF